MVHRHGFTATASPANKEIAIRDNASAHGLIK